MVGSRFLATALWRLTVLPARAPPVLQSLHALHVPSPDGRSLAVHGDSMDVCKPTQRQARAGCGTRAIADGETQPVYGFRPFVVRSAVVTGKLTDKPREDDSYQSVLAIVRRQSVGV